MVKSKKVQGNLSETLVQKECLKLGYQILDHNIKIMGIEIDLIVKPHSKEIWILEIKSISLLTSDRPFISPLQMKKICTIINYFSELYENHIIRGHLVLVINKKTQWIYDFFANWP